MCGRRANTGPDAAAAVAASGNAVNTPAVEDNFVNGVYGDLGTVHILTGPVGVKGAMPGDKLKIEIMDIKPLNKGFTMADRPLGFMDTVNAPEDYRAWTWWTWECVSSRVWGYRGGLLDFHENWVR